MTVTEFQQWKDLPLDAQKQLENAAKTLEKKRGERVYEAGDTPEGLYFVEKGLIGLTLIGLSGKEHLLRFFRHGQFFGHRSLFSKESYHGTAVVLEAATLQFVPKLVVQTVLSKYPELYEFLIYTLSKELRRCEIQRVMVLENQILSRTAQAVIYLKDLYPNHSWTRQEIANFCASTVSTVIKALAELEDRGLIRQEGRLITILDREGLLSLQEQELR